MLELIRFENELRKEFNHHNLSPRNPDALFRGGETFILFRGLRASRLPTPFVELILFIFEQGFSKEIDRFSNLAFSQFHTFSGKV